MLTQTQLVMLLRPIEDLNSLRKWLDDHLTQITEQTIEFIFQDCNFQMSSFQAAILLFWSADKFPQNVNIVGLANLCDRVQAFHCLKHQKPIDHLERFIEFLHETRLAQDECAICLKYLNTNENTNEHPVRTLVCLHSFHSCCISSWKLKNETCPLCRENIF